MIKNILFDLGAVLVKYDWRAYAEKKFEDKRVSDAVYDSLICHHVWDEMDRGVWSDEKIRETFVSFHPEYRKEILLALDEAGLDLQRFDYTVDWINSLKERGFKIYYLSNWSHQIFDNCGDTLDFLSLMDGGVFSWKEKVIKPEPEIYNILLDRYGLVADECVFFDDREKNARGADAVGIHGVTFTDYDLACEKLERIIEENR